MEVDQIQCKFPRISNGNGSLNSRKLVHSQEMGDQYPDDEEEGENGRVNATANGSGAADPGGGVGGYYGWPSSRIVRVSRATGGKDRHSKVLTSKGLRDRRVRLSVNTAIQFYDLQDRLGYDQPSKAVEWLLTAAASSIAQLPPMNSPFVELSNNKRMNTCGSNKLKLDSTRLDIDGNGGNSLHPRQEVTKSPGGSSNSETSKGSGISISRSESRIKARKRAKERVLEKEKEKENESSYIPSFTELLNGGINCISNIHNNKSIDVSAHQTPNRGNGENMDYFASVLLGPPATTRPGQMVGSPLFSAAANHHSELQPFSFAQENLVSAVSSAAVTRGTLQSNSPSLPSLPPRFPPTDGSPLNFFIGAAPHIDNHHHFLPGFDARLQLYYSDAHGDNIRQKGKEKN